jgi:hypothetical protein
MKLAPAAVVALFALCTACEEKLPPSGPSADDFERADLGDAWLSTGGSWHLENGALTIDHAYNHPLWLKKAIPQNAVIELDCWSDVPDGDVKVEAWGDGKTYATGVEYTASSYVFIFGGWHNTISVIAREEEHGLDRKQRMDTHVELGRHYHWRIERRGGNIDWQVDGKPFLSFDDKSPLRGAGHSYFAFNDWEAKVHFDNVKVTPLP